MLNKCRVTAEEIAKRQRIFCIKHRQPILLEDSTVGREREIRLVSITSPILNQVIKLLFNISIES